jgi:predicted nuclease with TOPRIM domain
MAKKTKAQLEEELVLSELEHKYYKDHYAGLAVAFEKQKEQYAELEKKYYALHLRYEELEQALEGAQGNFRFTSKVNERLNRKLAIAETAMDAMTLHIQALVKAQEARS